MPRSFDVSADSPATVEQVHSAFSDEDYWLARLATMNGSTALESLIVDDDQTVRVATTQDLGRDLVPGIVAKFYRRDLKVRHTETWRPIDGQLRGEINVAVSGAPGSGSGAALVAPTQDGSRMTFEGTVEFKVPLVGGTIESFIAREFARGIPDIQHFLTKWVTSVTETPNSASPYSDAFRVAPTTAEALAGLSMPLLEAMMTQRAVRRVHPDPVDDAVVLKCIELALRAPTGANGQNWEFIVVKDRNVIKKLAGRYRQGWKYSYGGLLRGAGDRDESLAKVIRAAQWQVDHFTEVPVLVVACLRLTVREGRAPYSLMPHAAVSGYWGSIYPSVQNLLLAARAMGLGASLITLPLWGVTRARRILGLPRSVTPCCVVALGWPRGRYGPTTRTPVEQVTHLDAYGNRAWLDAVTPTPS